jgi:hypothetical protein
MAHGLADLFGGIDGLKEDAMEFGVLAGAAVVGHAAAGYAFKFASAKFPQVPGWALNLGAIVLGFAAGKAGNHFGYRKVGTGLAVGLITAGASGFVRQYAPSVPLAGGALNDGYSTRPLLMGLGDGSADALYQRYLQGAPTQVTETGGLNPALNAAPTMVSETNSMHPALNGAPVVVEQRGGFNGLGKPGHPLFGNAARTFA